ncbi:glucose-6-phosphate dehydrogenase [Candidatus Kaiserbacteria bacterium RIFCSPHIGHO2_01_FULL_54_36]|uniref:Glucose-6-phosphate 1-dehydrogenase n=1 Tax=Candidatus Kaiserbacteria bacterium RIFCSPHIGHO2_01_FULL_54_36 TaxID=1798482 RepID=A0A1F6CNH6_9BACT|nr:MAG: glucose-6-phosphate dehydrogenase [Candidatus Kaiserbacteria bacterium RIFCSPHIGHO2_01_FULL_54_36]OGG76004.1 MAG: glucose-6-phosphate dehydrogenase [Candidatus Kaiserbacteria bacterium RIFCSPLOWO2_01_FULL_54_22]
MAAPTSNIPTIFAAFGATGDLMRRKVLPALYYSYKHGELPTMFKVVGFSRREWSDEEFRAYVQETLEEHAKGKIADTTLAPFLSMFKFQRGEFGDKSSYDGLKKTFDTLDTEWGVCSNKLFYLSVAPEFYELILGELSRSGLTDPCEPDQGWTHVIVEKPFGMDLGTAKQIDEFLAKLFTEDQIYRIDHYLAKEMLQNILTFRFSNNLFELSWDNGLIENIHIRVLEKIGVEKRGPFYDGVGAFRDVGQNHLLQMLALVTMDHPESFEAGAIQKKRAEILEALEIIPEKEMKSATFRGQYEGYRAIVGVVPDSDTETYFKVRATLNSPKWKGVPIVMESGKRLGAPLKEIVVTFRHPTPCLCPPGAHHKNEVIFRMEPREEILIEFWSKSLGFTFATERREFHYMLREQSEHVPYVEEYAKLLLDCVRGDQTLFIGTEEIRAMWRFTDPILAAWKDGVVPLQTYAPDSKEVLKNADYVK